MTDARAIWDTWRRILKNDALVAAIVHGQKVDPATLTDEERAIVAEYADDRVAADFTVGMYRTGLVRNTLTSLNLVPLTRRVFDNSGLDPDAVAEEFAQSIDYRDDGPNFWRAAADFVDFLAKRPDFAKPAIQDVFALDRAAIALVRKLGQEPPGSWPGNAVNPFPARESERYVASEAAVVVTTRHDMTPWLEDPAFDPRRKLRREKQYWLIYVPTADDAHTYAELSERAARAFALLSTGKTPAELAPELGLPLPEVLAVLDSLQDLGAVAPVRRNDASIALDPAVEILDAVVDDCALLCHTELNVGMVVPPGEGLIDFVRSLMGEPVSVETLREEYDDDDLIDEMLTALVGRGFARVTPEDGWPVTPPPMRRAVIIDLDAVRSFEKVRALWSGGEVRLTCARLSRHKKLFAELARNLRAHHVVVRTTDARCDAETRISLRRLGAAVEIDHVPWPAPDAPIRGLAELTRDCVSTHVIMAPGESLLDKKARKRCVEWMRAHFVSGLCLRLEPKKQFTRVFHAVHELEHILADVVITNLPGDEVLLGNTDRGWVEDDASDDARRFRLAYLRWRIPLLKSAEGDNPWSQIPEAEDKWIRSAEDMLPNHPELLGLKPGSVLVDTCGGMGRVARRLAPAVGEEGLVISIEMRRLITERARRFAYEGKLTNLQFRVGLTERLPIPDAAVDAAVNEWTGAIWELGLGDVMLKEMTRVVRPGGRIAVTHRLVQLQLDALGEPWVQYDDIVQWVRDAFDQPGLTIIKERVWGQVVPSKEGEPESEWFEQYMPRLVNPNNGTFHAEHHEFADVYLTVIAEKG